MTDTGFLLDTHVVLWAMSESPRLTNVHREILSGDAAYYVSAASVWELAIKRALGKLEPPADFLTTLGQTRAILLPITAAHADHVAILPHHHRDPFDRLLIAQAQIEDLTILSVDPHFAL